ncbi:hypothetical protein [Aquamicrobium sp. LC103]|uniref:tetratricopeptide repeat protein n=1 Tax=Aquamicrobium sp. LC103 TaxID=1120658 RepID=UPI00063E8BB7|nr:hypothetical protein [Aquamicrobium sp. LC103]
MRRSMPPAEQVHDALERIVTSETFSRSERARDLLRYLVEQHQAGNGDRLKGFSIAVDVFGKDSGFDPATDAVVRVQARRLRELLENYYEAEGRSETIRIAIPRGSYAPEYFYVDVDEFAEPLAFAAVEPASTPVQPPAASEPAVGDGGQVVRQLKLLSAALLVLIGLLGVIAYQNLQTPAASTEAASNDPARRADRVALTASVERDLLPAVFLATSEEDDATERVSAALRRGLAGFDTVEFIARDYDFFKNGYTATMDFIFTVTPGASEGEVLVELQNAQRGRAIFSRMITEAESAEAVVDDEIADVLTSVVTASGSIYAFIEEEHLETGLTRCLMLNDRYYRDQKADAHRLAYTCFERLIDQDTKSPLVYSELASLHMETITDRHDYPPNATVNEALELARKAIQLGPNSPYAHRAYGHVLSRTASVEESLRWARKAYELNTYDLSMAAAYASGLIFSGEYQQGMPIMQRAVTAASAHPTWWDYSLFLAKFMLSDYEGAADAVSLLATTRRAHYLAAQLIVADALGKKEEAAVLLEDITANYPRFSADPAGYFERGKYPQDLIRKLVDALRQAGLSSAT